MNNHVLKFEELEKLDNQLDGVIGTLCVLSDLACAGQNNVEINAQYLAIVLSELQYKLLDVQSTIMKYR